LNYLLDNVDSIFWEGQWTLSHVDCITRSGKRQQIAELGVENTVKFAQNGDI